MRILNEKCGKNYNQIADSRKRAHITKWKETQKHNRFAYDFET